MRSALYPVLFSDPMSQWARDAVHAWDFLKDKARWNRGRVGALANTPGWSYTRADAQTAYAQTSAGVLTPFATGVLRRTDKGVLIEGARTNLCLRSQEFDNAAWTKTRASISADAVVAPDGTTTADKLVEDSTATNTHVIQPASGIGTVTATETLSIYAKAAERSWISLQLGANRIAYFNVSAGTVGTTSGSTTATITALANGWYRCAISGVRDTNTNNIIYLASGDGSFSYTGDGTSGLYLWGAQLEAAAFASSYIPTTTASATRAAEALTVAGTNIVPLTAGTLFTEFDQPLGAGADQYLLDWAVGSEGYAKFSGGGVNLHDGTGYKTATVPSAGVAKHGVRYDAGDSLVRASLNGAAVVSAAFDGSLSANTTLYIGRSASGNLELFGYLRRVAIWTRALTDSELQTVTT